MSPPAIATLVAGRYRLDGELCSAPFTRVWRGTDVVLNRQVAVRVLDETTTGDVRARFRGKARMTGAVSHSGITRVYDFDDSEAARVPFQVTEYVDGSSLTQLMADGPMKVTDVLSLVEQAAWALDAAHRAGLCHGAIKPSNVLVSRDGRVKLADFGGSPEQPYLAPELADGSAPTAAGDLYALGMLARECLIGAEGRATEAEAILVTLTEIDPGRRLADARTVAVRAGEMLRPHLPPGRPPRAPRRWHAPRPHVPHPHAVLPLAAVGAVIAAFMLGRGLGPHAQAVHVSRTVAVTVNGTALVGKPVSVVRDELRRMGLSVSVQWRVTTRLSPGLVVTVWPSGKVPPGSWVVVTGALRGSTTPGVSESAVPRQPAAVPRPVKATSGGHGRHATPGAKASTPAATPTATPSPTDSAAPSASPSPSASPTPAPSSTPSDSPVTTAFISALPGSEVWILEPET